MLRDLMMTFCMGSAAFGCLLLLLPVASLAGVSVLYFAAELFWKLRGDGA